MKLEVQLPSKMVTKGAVMVHQIKSLDFNIRQADFVEKAPPSVIQQVTLLAKEIIS